ncbi:LppU/SCO3897 family protein [Actinophytocola glycyrrhizae]|uniref:Uncharacterized protein n=1 Tax=Actinophytocola glycyrrhizae TaxID=2044873 RepID=A0ABV9RXL9_9PSEU
MTTPTVPPPGDTPATPPAHDPATAFSPDTHRIFVIGVLVLVFGGIAAFVVVKLLNPPAPAYSAGDCVQVVEGGRYDAAVEKVGCAEEAALYEVGVYLDDPDEECSSDAYSSYKQTGGNQQEYKLCLMINAAEGDCLRVPTIAMGEEKKVACTSEEANRKVTRVIEGTADQSACDPESAQDARVYPNPKRTVCIGPVGA